MRQTFSSGLALEEQIGYSRAVRVGPVLYTSATAPVDEAMNLVGTTGYEQAAYVLQKLGDLLTRAGFTFADVAFARLYIADPERAATAYDAFREVFHDIRPAVAVVNVLPWPDPDMLLEIELVAHRSEDDGA